MSKALNGRPQDLKSYITSQSKKSLNSDARSGNNSRYLFRRTLTPNNNLRLSGKVTEATFAAESESVVQYASQTHNTQRNRQSALDILVQNDLVACQIFDEMIRNQIRRIAGSYF